MIQLAYPLRMIHSDSNYWFVQNTPFDIDWQEKTWTFCEPIQKQIDCNCIVIFKFRHDHDPRTR